MSKKGYVHGSEFLRKSTTQVDGHVQGLIPSDQVRRGNSEPTARICPKCGSPAKELNEGNFVLLDDGNFSFHCRFHMQGMR